MPNFKEPFVIETNSNDFGIGAVLMQNEQPSAYLSKTLGPRNTSLSTHEKEMLAIVIAVNKWSHYLSLDHFVIRTDHQALKHFLSQRITSLLQQKWLTMLLGLSYESQYKRGVENTAADGLSRIPIQRSKLKVVTALVRTWTQELQTSLERDTSTKICTTGNGAINRAKGDLLPVFWV